jgi:hypothetical protein
VHFGERSGAAASKLVLTFSPPTEKIEPEAHALPGVAPTLVTETFYDMLAIVGTAIDACAKMNASYKIIDTTHQTIVDHGPRPPRTKEEFHGSEGVNPPWVETAELTDRTSAQEVVGKARQEKLPAAETAEAYLLRPMVSAWRLPIFGASAATFVIVDGSLQRSVSRPPRDDGRDGSEIYPKGTLQQLLETARVNLEINATYG